MHGITLVWAALTRHKGRAIFTWLSIVIAFMLFGVLAAVRYGMVGQLTITSAERIETFNRIAQLGPMPLSYYARITRVPGVVAAIYFNGFGGYYQQPKNQVNVLATNTGSVTEVYPEFTLSAAEKRAWLTDRQGAIAGPALARRMGWNVGQTVAIQSQVPQKDGSSTWYFHLDGIYHADLPSLYQDFFVVHYQYLNQGIADARAQNIVTQYTERIDDPRNAARISAAVDAVFADSSPQTLTQPQQREVLSEIRQFGDLTAIVIYLGIAVFFALLLVVGNSQAQSVRERTAEFAMIRALGFRRRWVLLLVFSEAFILIMSGAIVGLVLGWLLTRAMYPLVGNILSAFGVTWDAAVAGIILAVLFSALATLVPAFRVLKLRVAEALRST
ncbi:MAG: ABC transporter permease [Gammaproteobacteria bacterium]